MRRRAILLAAALIIAGCSGKDDASSGGPSSAGSTSGVSEGSSGSGGSAGSGSSGTSTDTDGGSGSEGSSGGVDVATFERFMLSTAAGPCPPDADCDGFIELLAGGTLRVERFGDVADEVIVVQIAAEDYAAAVQVFADPELSALLDAPEPLCDPPTDIFESMLVVIDGVTHDAETTACEQAPLAAARSMAHSLEAEYAP